MTPLVVQQAGATSGGVLRPIEVVLDAAGATADVAWSAAARETLSDGETPWAAVKPPAGVVPAGSRATITVVPSEAVCAQVAKAGRAGFHVHLVLPGGEAVVTDIATRP